MHVAAVIVAGGQGARMGADRPKQLLTISGRTLLQHSVALCDQHPSINELVVVLPDSLVDAGADLIGPTRCTCRVVAGGPRRQDSVQNGARAVSAGADVVLVHDAARPFADRALIDRVIAAAVETGAAVPAVASRDTVKRRDRGSGMVRESVPRAEIWLAQTPQGFRRDVMTAIAPLGAGDREATDESMLVEWAGLPVKIVDGDERNVKITTPDDLAAARGERAAAPRVGTGYDLHRLVEGRALVLAGISVPFERGPLGHSDGDVLCHALTDAVLGAAGAGDIGRHFPNTDPAWKDAPGLDLLARAVAIVRAAGFQPASADVSIILERPKLSPFVDTMRERVAGVLGVSISAVSIKGKTNEGVDAVGRGEAIAAHAVAVLTCGGAS
jgi:2-C-methyl-D-erythritol 4-phosphate cytidylyltransferase/2-C-methyl-D-erythritol 2,4-cyclodiphosphate synthase